MKKIALYESRKNNNEFDLSNFQDLYGLEKDGYEYYCDSVKSRIKIMNRPELQRLIKDVKKGKISKIIVPSINHISRNIEYVLDFIDVMNKNNCPVVDKYNNEYGREMLDIWKVIALSEKEIYQKKKNKFFAEKDYDNNRERTLKEYLKLNNLSKISRTGKEWDKFNVWFNEEKEHKKIQFINTNIFSEDYLYDVLISRDGISKISMSIKTKNDINKDDEMYELLSTIYDKYIDYMDLPKLSACSPLLQELYKMIASSDKNGIVISIDDWERQFIGKYTEKDYENLVDEKNKFHLTFGLELNNDYYDYDDYYENDEDEELDEFKILINKELLSEINNDYNLELNMEVEL